MCDEATPLVTRVRVGIVSWNTTALLDRCLSALPAATEGLDNTIVVVDNASTDGSVEVARAHNGVHVVVNEANAGYAVAMNQALRGSDADVLIALNPDTEPPPGALSRLVEQLLSAPDVGLVAPKLVNADGTLQPTAYRFPSLALAAAGFVPPGLLRRGLGARWWFEGYASHNAATDVDWLVGAVHVMRAAAVDPAGPYRERWFMYAEDLDLCWRLAGAGWRRRLEADVEISHVGNAAGAQALGNARIARYVRATHEWYATEHGSAQARAWAALSAGGLALRIAARLPNRRDEVPSLARALRAHLGCMTNVAGNAD